MPIILPSPGDVSEGAPAARSLTVSSPAIPVAFGQAALEPVRLSGREGVNGLFDYELILKTPDALNADAVGAADFDLDAFVGCEIGVQIQLEGSGLGLDALGAGTREVNAMIVGADFWGEEGRYDQYRLALRPWLHLATLRTNCKVFQNQNVVRTLDELLTDYAFPVDKRLAQTYPARDYQTQFNESDFQFFERLCQEWGINYYFEHSQGAHRLVLTDSLASHLPNPSAAYQVVDYHAPGWKADAEYIHAFVPESRLTSGRYTSRDQDYTRPRADLTVSSAAPRPTAQAGQEVYAWQAGEGGSHYAQPNAGTATNEPLAEGRLLADLRMQALRTGGARARARGNLRGMVPGCRFSLQGHPRARANAEYLVLDCQLLIEEVAQASQVPGAAAGRRQQWRVEANFTVHPMTEPLRPALTRAKPFSPGAQVALVVGPEGQNLWTDELGRVKVQFPWDRIGPKNQNAGCWLRVNSGWAGNQLGAVQLPRIGQEVLVDFIGGDPDLPLVSGRVHNQVNLPPWRLPGQSALSGFRSRELTRQGGNGAGGRSNHLVLDDTEQKIQAQLKSDHQSSSLSLGYVTRIEDNAGRKDARGEGFELRTDAHGAIRAQQGLLITTEARPNAAKHLLDSAETLRRLTEARNLHESGAELAQKMKAQAASDQQAVAEALKAQNDAIKGSGPANPGTGAFPELNQPHLVLASPAGIEATSQFSTHLASVEHTAITSGRHTSLTSGDSLLAVAMQAIKLFAAQRGIEVIAAQAEIQLQALEASLHLLAKDEITLQADKITIEAHSELKLNGGGSYAQYAGGIESGTQGADVRRAASHNVTGPSGRGSPVLPSGIKPGKGQLELKRLYHERSSFESTAYTVTDVLGAVRSGQLDSKGFATISGLAQGGAHVAFDLDPRTEFDQQRIRQPEWPKPAGVSDAAAAVPKALSTAVVSAFANAVGNDGGLYDTPQPPVEIRGNRDALLAELDTQDTPSDAHYDPLGNYIGPGPSSGAAPGGAEPAWVVGIQTPYPKAISNAVTTIGQAAFGGAQIVASGIYNQAVKIGSGVASLPYFAVGGVDAAVGVQQEIQQSLGWTPDSDSARMVTKALDPIAQTVAQTAAQAIDPVQAFSQKYLGDGVTTAIATTLQAGMEIAGIVGAGRVMQRFVNNSLVNGGMATLAPEAVARRAYESTGWSSERIDSHLAGIDFTQPIEMVTLPQGTLVNQFQVPGQRVGSYFAPIETSADTIGVDVASRVPSLFVTTSDVQVLRSTAANIIDWKGSGSIFQGGGIQYFAPNNLGLTRVPNQ